MTLPSLPRALSERFEIIGKLGEGGMGVVFHARQRHLDRHVALKICASPLPEDAERFRVEVRALAALDHPAIVRVYEADLDGDQPYVVMELVAGESLAARLARGPLAVDESLRIALAIAEGLAHAHQLGIIHRDVKPPNVLLTFGGEPRLTDFGIAKFLGTRTSAGGLTKTGMVVGSPHYISPEQIRGEGAGTASDTYGLGATLFEMLTGRPPFPGDATAKVLLAHLEQPAPVPSSLVPGISPAVDELVAMLLDKDPRKRPVDGSKSVEVIRRAQAGDSPRGTKNTRRMTKNPIAAVPAQVARPSHARIWAAAAAAFLAGGLVFGIALRPRRPLPEPSPPSRTAQAAEPEPSEGSDREIVAKPLDKRAARVAALMSVLNKPLSVRIPIDGGTALALVTDAAIAMDVFIPPPPVAGMELSVKMRPRLVAPAVSVRVNGGDPITATATGRGEEAAYRLPVTLRTGRNRLEVRPTGGGGLGSTLDHAELKPLGPWPLLRPARNPDEEELQGELRALEELSEKKAWESPPESVAACRKILEKHPRRLSARCRLAGSLHRAGKLSEALDEFEVALVAVPERMWTWCDLGAALRDQRRFDEARRVLVHALRMSPGEAWLWNNLGRLERACGKPREAATFYRTAVEVWPKEVSHHIELGEVLVEVGDRKAAGEAYTRALAIAPGDARLLERLGELSFSLPSN
jgi:Flp pilus assembly protein TadD